MSLRPPRFMWADLVELERWCNETKVEPSDGTITDDSFDTRSPYSVIGNPGSAEATPQDIEAGAEGRFLVRRSEGLVFEALADADIPSGIARDSEVAAAVSAHEALSDPHTGYVLEVSGTYTATYTGINGADPTGTVRYEKNHNQVTLYIPSGGGTSDADTFTITGMPEVIRPTRDQGFAIVLVQDNSTFASGLARVLTTGVIELKPAVDAAANDWTASGTKTVDHLNLSYSLS